MQLDEICFLPRGKIRQVKNGEVEAKLWVYQRVYKHHGNLPLAGNYGLQIRRHVIPFDPKTPEQLERRDRFRTAVQEWQTLPAVEKEEWKRLARSENRSGYNHFISYKMRAI